MQVQNISNIFEAQKATDEVILTNKGLTRESTFEKRVLALIVELGETAQSWRAFKFWSEDQEPRIKKMDELKGYKNPLLEEYVDSLHFLVSLGIDLGIEQVELREIDNDKPIERQFIELANMTSLLIVHKNNIVSWNRLFSAFIRLGDDLGFTWNEVYDAYFEKNKVNHQRQESGY